MATILEQPRFLAVLLLAGAALLWFLRRATEDDAEPLIDYTSPAFGAGGDPGDDAEPGAMRAGRAVGDVLNTVFGPGATAPAIAAGSKQEAALAVIHQALAMEPGDFPAPWVLMGIAEQETRFDNSRVGADGEIGMMQVMPATGGQFGFDPISLGDAVNNVVAAIRYLRWCADFARRNGEGDNLATVLACYNAGVGNVFQRGYIPHAYVSSTLGRIRKWERTLAS